MSNRTKLQKAILNDKPVKVNAVDVSEEKKLLSLKQLAFAEIYLQTFNIATAGEAVGIRRDAASRMYHRPEVKAFVEKRLSEYHISANEVLAIISSRCRTSMEDFVDTKGNIDILRGRKRNKMHLVKRYRVGKDGVSIELVDPENALKIMGEHHGIIKPPDGSGKPSEGDIIFNNFFLQLNQATPSAGV